MKTNVQGEYLSVEGLSTYSGISKRTLWDLIKSPIHPIPHFRVGSSGRIVRIKKADFDEWIEKYRAGNDEDIDAIVSEILK